MRRSAPGAEAGGHEEDEHAGNHEVVEVVLDHVEPLAGGGGREEGVRREGGTSRKGGRR